MALKDFAEGRTDVYKIDPKKLKIKEGWNSRDFNDPANIEHVKTLAASIREVGVKEPLKVNMEDNVPYVTNGECRYRAVMLLIEQGVEIKSVPVMGEDRFANEADRLFTQFLSNSGKPFGPIENARLFKRLIDMGWAQKDIAGKSGMSAGRVSQLLELNTLPISIQQLIVEGKVSSAFALTVWKKHSGNLEAAFAELSAALEAANADGRIRAMPKDTGDGEGSEGGGSKGRSGGTKSNLKSFIKKLVEQAYADERIDDTESMVTMTLSEAGWAELMEKIDY
jgi:ParB/RepB/Spo0J family partition protein